MTELKPASGAEGPMWKMPPHPSCQPASGQKWVTPPWPQTLACLTSPDARVRGPSGDEAGRNLCPAHNILRPITSPQLHTSNLGMVGVQASANPPALKVPRRTEPAPQCSAWKRISEKSQAEWRGKYCGPVGRLAALVLWSCSWGWTRLCKMSEKAQCQPRLPHSTGGGGALIFPGREVYVLSGDKHASIYNVLLHENATLMKCCTIFRCTWTWKAHSSYTRSPIGKPGKGNEAAFAASSQRSSSDALTVEGLAPWLCLFSLPHPL